MGKLKKKSAEQEAKELEILERGARVIELRKAGASFRSIARKLKDEGVADVTYQTVRRDFQAAMALSREHRKELADEYLDLQIERAESLMLAYWILAIGKTEAVKDPESGDTVIKVTKPSISAGYLYMTIWSKLNELLYGNTVKHEHTGKDGKPIEMETKVYAGFDWDDI